MAGYARWVWRKAEPTSLARFVNAGCAASVLPQIRLPSDRSVHEAVTAGDRKAVARALYDAVATLELDYDIESYTADGQHSQVVRTPPEMRDRRRATCLDLALLFAGLALDLTLRPVVIVLEGHALIAIVNIDFALEIDQNTDVGTLLEWMDPDAGTLIPIECTGATTGKEQRTDFDTAVRRGRENVERKPFLFAIDPYRLQRDHGLAPASCDARPRRWLVPALAGAVAVAVGGSWLWWPDPLPVFSTGVEGVVVPAVPDAPGTGEWLAEGLQAAAEGDGTLVDVSACGQVARLEVWGPKEAARVDLTDPDNPAHVDVVLAGARAPVEDGSQDMLMSVAVEPLSTTLTQAADPVLLTLGSSPAVVDVDRDPLVIYPELAVLPAVVLGLRQLELGSDQSLTDADCLFALADESLAGSNSPRVQRYRASVAVLAANGHILQASALTEEQEAEHLRRARALLAQAETHVEDTADLGVVRANGMAVDLLTMITDDGTLASTTTRADAEALLVSLDETAQLVSQASPAAYIALRSMSAKLLLATARQGPDRELVDDALGRTDLALARAEALTGSQGRRQLAEVFEIRGIAWLMAGNPTAAVSEFEAAASHARGLLHHEYNVDNALARIARCQDGDPEVINDLLMGARQWLDSHDSESLSERADAAASLAEERCA